MDGHLTTGEAAREINEAEGVDRIDTWHVRRIVAVLNISIPRFAGKRAIPRAELPTIINAMRSRGWLPSEEDAAV